AGGGRSPLAGCEAGLDEAAGAGRHAGVGGAAGVVRSADTANRTGPARGIGRLEAANVGSGAGGGRLAPQSVRSASLDGRPAGRERRGSPDALGIARLALNVAAAGERVDVVVLEAIGIGEAGAGVAGRKAVDGIQVARRIAGPQLGDASVEDAVAFLTK